MPQYSNSGQFGGSAYNNPQMNQGWYNQNDQNAQWQQGFAPNESAWRGPASGHHGQDYSYNPMTGQGSWENTSGGLKIGGSNPYGHGSVMWTDPNTGMTSIDPSRLQGLISGFSGGSDGGYQNYEMTDYQGGNVSAPGGYGGFDYSAIGSGIDPSAVIDAQEYKLQEAMDSDMAKAGGRLGQSGFAMSTPYAGEVAGAARKAAQDRNAITMQYQYDAAQQQAQRDLAQQLQAGQHDFGGWQTQGGWDMQSQLANQGMDFGRWQFENQIGMQNNQGQNQWNQNQQGYNQNLLASILGGLF